MRTKFLALLLVLSLAAACGGGGEAQKPSKNTEQSTGNSGGDAKLITDDQLDAIKNFLDRKRRLVSRCFGDAIEAGELNKNKQAAVDATFVVQPDGTLGDVKLTLSQDSEKLRTCMTDYMSKWVIVELPSALPYSYRYAYSPY